MDKINTYIYGAGDFGKKLYRYISDNNICDIKAFVQSTRPTAKTVDGLEVLSFDDIHDDNAYFLIAVANHEIAKAIQSDIELKGYQGVNCSGFIRDNNGLMQGYKHFCILCGNQVQNFADGG